MFVHNINPILLKLGFLEIRWYGIMYVLGFIATYYYLRLRKEKFGFSEKEIDDLLGLMVIGMIAGARLFYAIFYDQTLFLQKQYKLLFIWEGGLSFHGGFLGIAITALWYCKRISKSFLKLADNICTPLALANAFGRIGNFINGELYGIPTSFMWGVVFPMAEGARHPTQIYEAMYNVIIFATLFLTKDREWKDGRKFGLFMIMYAVFRFSVEFIKDLPSYGMFTMGQWLTIPVLLIGIWLAIRNV